MIPRRFLALLALALLAGAPARAAQDVSVSASLSRNVAAAGEPVVLSIVVSGSRNASVPDEIRADGLQIGFAGQSTQIQMRNFDVSTSISYNYQVVADAPGKYVIPSQRITVAGNTYRTNPVTLTATQSRRPLPGLSGPRGQAPATAEQQDDLSQIAFAEMIVPRKSVYVGEAVPVELRFYFDPNVNFRATEPPSLEGEGFTASKFPEPRQERITRNGRTLDVVTYETLITPVKAGPLELGPVRMQCVASIPRARQNLRHFGLDDFFNDDFFNNPMGAFNQQREVLVRSGVEKLDVQSLPREGQPPGFSGAIGRFQLLSEASPKHVNVGEPVTLKLRVEGRGNFDRMGEPAIEESAGWRSYPPSSNFEARDSLGLDGVRTFEYALIPNRNETQLPQASFAYFDPDLGKYFTLQTQEMPVQVEGAPAATPAPVARARSTASAAPAPAADPAEREIHYILTGPASWGASFEPLFERPAFWLAQLVPLAALLGFIGLRIHQRRAGDVKARELAALRERRAACEKALRRGDATGAEFFEHAVQLIQVDTALRTGVPPATVDVRAALRAHPADSETGEAVRRIFSARDERMYAGHREDASIDPAERARTMDTLHRFLKNG